MHHGEDYVALLLPPPPLPGQPSPTPPRLYPVLLSYASYPIAPREVLGYSEQRRRMRALPTLDETSGDPPTISFAKYAGATASQEEERRFSPESTTVAVRSSGGALQGQGLPRAPFVQLRRQAAGGAVRKPPRCRRQNVSCGAHRRQDVRRERVRERFHCSALHCLVLRLHHQKGRELTRHS